MPAVPAAQPRESVRADACSKIRRVSRRIGEANPWARMPQRR